MLQTTFLKGDELNGFGADWWNIILFVFRYDAPHKLAHKNCVQKRNHETRKHLLTNNHLM